MLGPSASSDQGRDLGQVAPYLHAFLPDNRTVRWSREGTSHHLPVSLTKHRRMLDGGGLNRTTWVNPQTAVSDSVGLAHSQLHSGMRQDFAQIGVGSQILLRCGPAIRMEQHRIPFGIIIVPNVVRTEVGAAKRDKAADKVRQ
jgi:hypothetical protein